MSTGRIFDIQRFAIHDGPGIRTTVFLKGCPLRCLWCSNPEGVAPGRALSYQADRCIACGDCFPLCPSNALAPEPSGKVRVECGRCTNCGECVPACAPGALEMIGRDVTVEEVLEVVLRDADYYRQSRGGLTLSGGDPLFQPEFAESLLCAAKQRDLHCVVETSGYAAWEVLEPLMPVVDLWLFDYKETDPDLHVQFTGRDLETVLDRLERLHAAGAKILLRCPMIPQHNARPEHLDGIVALTRKLPNLVGVDLLPYFDLWRSKWKRFGLVSRLPETVKPPTRQTVESWKEYLRARQVPTL